MVLSATMRKAVAVSALATTATAASFPRASNLGKVSLASSSSSFHCLTGDLTSVTSVPRGGASKEDVPPAATATATSEQHHDKSPHQQRDAVHPETTTASSSAQSSKKKKKKGANRRSSEPTDEKKDPASSHRRPSSSSSSASEKADSSHDSNEHDSSHTSRSHHTMSPHQEKIVNEILKEDDYYKILGTTRDATPTEIQKAYRKRAVLTHPDKMPNSDRRAFDKVAEAYDVLNDETKRKQYNQFGKTGGGAPSAEDIFRSFFSSQHHPYFRGAAQTPTAPRRNRNVRYQLEVSLEELYKGMTRSVLVSQPTTYGHFQHHQPKRKRVEVHIPAGSFSGQSVVLSGEMDWDQEQTPADIVFILVQRPHPVFTRKGYDLAMELTITLDEAIGGVRRSFTHLDGRTVVVESAHNAHSDVPLVIQTGSIQVLKGEGMPKRNGKGHGDLYIQYKVEMPSPTATRQNLTPTECEELKQLLSKLQRKHSHAYHERTHHDGAKDEDQDVVRVLHTASASDFGRNGPEPEDEEHDAATNTDQDDESSAFRAFPFGASPGRQFFFSSGSSSADSHPFFRDDWKDDGNGNVQCQQM